jgi:hypothetical protein
MPRIHVPRPPGGQHNKLQRGVDPANPFALGSQPFNVNNIHINVFGRVSAAPVQSRTTIPQGKTRLPSTAGAPPSPSPSPLPSPPHHSTQRVPTVPAPLLSTAVLPPQRHSMRPVRREPVPLPADLPHRRKQEPVRPRSTHDTPQVTPQHFNPLLPEPPGAELQTFKLKNRENRGGKL